jgi:hypothetical protein
MNGKTSLVVLMLTHLGLCAFGRTNTLSFVIQTNKREYDFGEPVVLTYRLSNTDPLNPVAVNTRSLVSPLLFARVTNPEGKALSPTAETPRIATTGTAVRKVLSPGESHSNSFDLSQYYGDTYPFNSPHNFDAPGEYTISAVYVSDLTAGSPKYEASPLVIHVKPLSPRQADDLLHNLRDNQSTNRLKALGLLRRSQVRQVVPVAFEILQSSSDSELKQEAARSIYELADGTSRRQIADHLKMDDQVIKGFMALTLGRLKDKESVPMLIDMCNPEQHPESYRSALKALTEIGDPRAIPSLERAAERDQSSEMRDMARNAVRKLKAGLDSRPGP